LDLDIVSDQYLLLAKWRAACSASSSSLAAKSLEEVVKREIRSKASCLASTAEPTKSSTAEWPPGTAKRIAAGTWAVALAE
jgi:hypothetical protein